MTDPCLTATIVDNVTITDMHTTVKVGSYVTQSFVNYKDNFSSTYGTADGYTICGTRTYAMDSTCDGLLSGFAWVHEAADLTDLVDANTISIKTELDADISFTGHTCTMTVKLTDYPTQVTHTENFTVVITECLVTSFTSTTSIAA